MSLSYGTQARDLFDRVSKAAPRSVLYLVDSSKTGYATACRPLALVSIAGLDVRVVHLVRDGRACIWSILRAVRRHLGELPVGSVFLLVLRSSAAWGFANLAAHLFGILHPRAYHRLRYEDLVRNPDEVLSALGFFLGVDLAQEAKALKAKQGVPHTHQIAGNSGMRSKAQLFLKEDVEWKTKAPAWQSALFWLLNWPLALWYGYGRR